MKFKSPDDIMKRMENIEFGWFDINNEKHNTIEKFQELYRVATNEEILEHKMGSCFDLVELERFLFRESCITYSYAITAPHMIHAFLILERENKYIYFEYSSYKSRGIYYFDTKDELLEYAIKAFIDRHHIDNKNKVRLISYPPLEPMTTFNELKNILLNSKNG